MKEKKKESNVLGFSQAQERSLKKAVDEYIAAKPRIIRIGLRESNALKCEVNNLPFIQLAVIHLIYWKGFSEVELPEILGIKYQSVKANHQLALKTLRGRYLTRILKSRNHVTKGERRLLAKLR